MIQAALHYFLHFGFPVFIAVLLDRQNWRKIYLILIATMLVDVDHLLANPIFDANRCSINFHPLHTYYAMMIYVIALIPPKTRIVAIGLLFHMLTDTIDCWMQGLL